MQDLTNQIALVTGASSGIGQAIAISLAQAGATVCLLGRNASTLAASAALVGPRARIYECDITDDGHVRSLPARIAHEVGHIDLLIHSAAVYTQGPFETASIDDFDVQFKTNLRAPYLVTQQFLPHLQKRPGQIVFINSTQGVQARPLVTQYAAVKFGLRALADSLRQELIPTGIRVLSVFPGQTATPMQALRHQMEAKAYDPASIIQPVDIADAVTAALRLPRTATVTELHIRPGLK